MLMLGQSLLNYFPSAGLNRNWYPQPDSPFDADAAVYAVVVVGTVLAVVGLMTMIAMMMASSAVAAFATAAVAVAVAFVVIDSD